MKIVARTDVGLIRDNNQDSYTAIELEGGDVLAVVCDGMGGAAEGAYASSKAVEIMENRILSAYHKGMSDISIKTLLSSAAENANKSLFNLSFTDPKYEGMGTTVVAAIVTDEFAYIVHAGDSRAYKITNGECVQLTRDHSVVQKMLEDGEITPEQVKGHPKKNLITRAVGVDQTLRTDFCQEPFEDNDILILCSDGLTNYTDPQDLKELTNDGNYHEYAGRLVDLANRNGGGDNITVVAVMK